MLPSTRPGTPGQRVLGLFAKHPRPGQVKTRLAAATSAEWAAQVAEAFLPDLLDRLSPLPVQRLLVFDPPDAELAFRVIAGDRFLLTPQSDGDLGHRLSVFLFTQVQGGASAVVVLGTDSPTLPLT